jgi:uncharacterized BrkB/YihY/UPF0761 family membrane protein
LRARVEQPLRRTGEQLRARHEDLRRRAGWADVATRVLERHVDASGSMMAGYLAYRLFLLMLPLAVIVVALAGFDQSASESTSEHLRLGEALTSVIAQAGADAQRSRAPLLATGLLAFTIAAWGLLGALQYTAATAWQIPTRRFPGKGRVFVRLAASLLVFGVVLYVSLVVRRAGLWAGMAGSLANTIGAFVGFLGLGWILPRRCKEWFWLLPGAAVSAVGYLLIQAVAAFYLPGKLSNASATYGALGITLTLLTYLFLIGALLWFVQVVNAVVWEQHRHDPPGLLRRIADRIPIPTTTFGSGYVGEGEDADTVGSALSTVRNASIGDRD